jgi:hypothetical protein
VPFLPASPKGERGKNFTIFLYFYNFLINFQAPDKALEKKKPPLDLLSPPFGGED